ncbi:MAG: hypothetical protein ACE3JQ_05465 [Paenisporosarcina sp.]
MRKLKSRDEEIIIEEVDFKIIESLNDNWDDEWKCLIEDKGQEYINYALLVNGSIEGLMTIKNEMIGSLEIYKLEVSITKRKIGYGTHLISYACWLASTTYKETAKGLVSLYAKESSEGFYEQLEAKKMDEWHSYFLFEKHIVFRLAQNFEEGLK